MNENIDLTKILKDCPKGFKLYSLLHGEVSFRGIDETSNYPIIYDYLITSDIGVLTNIFYLTRNGAYSHKYNKDCLLFPSKEQRDWSKFTAPWYKKEKFNPNTLCHFDRVLVRNDSKIPWRCDHFSHINNDVIYKYCASINYKFCIPYNDETKHLIGTTEEAPDFYKYWED